MLQGFNSVLTMLDGAPGGGGSGGGGSGQRDDFGGNDDFGGGSSSLAAARAVAAARPRAAAGGAASRTISTTTYPSDLLVRNALIVVAARARGCGSRGGDLPGDTAIAGAPDCGKKPAFVPLQADAKVLVCSVGHETRKDNGTIIFQRGRAGRGIGGVEG